MSMVVMSMIKAETWGNPKARPLRREKNRKGPVTRRKNLPGTPSTTLYQGGFAGGGESSSS